MRRLLVPVTAVLVTAVSIYAGNRLYQARATDKVSPAVTLAGIPRPPGTVSASLLGTTRPDFSLPDLYGKDRHISEWDGQVIIINFWATWCPPCLREIPAFITLQDRYGGDGVQFIGIALQTAAEAAGFARDQGMNYPVLAGEMEVVRLARALGDESGTLPYTVILDRDGKIRFIRNGELHADEAQAVISGLL